jgi:hypothetical protein
MESKDSHVAIVCKTRTAGGGTRQQLRIGLNKNGTRLALKLSNEALASRFRNQFPQVRPDAKPRMKAAFIDKKRSRLLIDCHGVDDRYTIKVIHKTVSSDGNTVDKRVGMITECVGRDAAVKQFDEYVADALEKGWRRTGKGKAFKCHIADRELMAGVATWLEAQLRSDVEGTSNGGGDEQ